MSIEFKNVNYIYNEGSPFEYQGLKNINFNLADKKFVAIIGHTGSGKSTLLQHFDALLKPSSGEINIDDFVINNETSNKNLKGLRKKVGIVFQFPENQLFAETVLKDVMFGPLNFGMSTKEAEQKSRLWLKKVGINEEYFDKSPFDLSGGQMRRVAIAGVLAYEPDILCLDEPAAGLDPVGQLEMMDIFKNYQKEGHTVILITHEMEDVAKYADEVLVLEKGELIKFATPKEVFSSSQWVKQHSLSEPEATQFSSDLVKAGFELDSLPLTVDMLAEEIGRKLNNE